MIDKKSYKTSIAKPLETANFVKKGQSWHFDGEDAVVKINLQKSDWGEEYYINIGIWLKALGESETLSKTENHLSIRAERLFPDKRDLIRVGSSLEKSNEELLNKLSEFVELQLLPFLKQCTQEAALREFLINGRFRHGLVQKEAEKYLTSK